MTELSGFTEAPKLCVAQLPIAGARYHHLTVSDDKSAAVGFGGGGNLAEAQTKALYEWLERRVYREHGPAGGNSSGWAAQTSLEAARSAASAELLERDAVLCAWLLQKSPVTLGAHTFAIFSDRFPLLLFGGAGGILVLGVLLKHGSSKGRMLITAAAASVEAGLAKLQVDAERAFSLLEGAIVPADPAIAAHHHSFCALADADLQWLEAGGAGLALGAPCFQFEDYRVPLWNGQTAYVSRATSPELQALYFGPANLRTINRRRLRSLGTKPFALHRKLHPIL